jgi:hypothetical protein
MFGIVTGTDLVYNIVEEYLEGTIDGVSISAHAVAGGRAGSKLAGVVNPLLANNPYATGVKLSDLTPGGPLVMGRYTMKTHESRSNWIRLVPFADNNMGNRAGFAIHGRGKRGSDGCIVPTDFNMVLLLYKLVGKREEAGSPAPTLAVIAAGDLDFIDQKLKTLSQTA